MNTSPLDLPGFPRDSEGPVFKEPCEAKAFAKSARAMPSASAMSASTPGSVTLRPSA